MGSSIFLRERSRTFPNLLHTLYFVRSMGGGPRTFPGGLNKWQWKRLHEKKAKEKEKRLLDQEKQLYQARVRSEIRAKLSDSSSKFDSNPPNYSPVSPQDQIKALADRFMKEGAEDLWNENDGPLSSPPEISTQKIESKSAPIDLRNLVSNPRSVVSSSPNETSSGFNNWSKPRHFSVYLCSDRRNLGNLSNGSKLRHYSVDARRSVRPSRFNFRRNDSSTTEDDSDDEGYLMTIRDRKLRGEKLATVGNESLADEDDNDGRRSGKNMMSSAALGKYDTKTKKRVPLKLVEQEDDLSQHVLAIRNELNKRMAEKEGARNDEDSILSEKRFEDCDVSPLTIKALTLARYVQMTRVQEATLSACLEGKDALVKAKTGTGKSAAFLLPAIETVLKASSSNTAQRIPPICVLILCPTRELAIQIAAEANVMLKFHDGIGVQTLIGGTRFKVDQKRLESDPCHIVVATPGRLLDHIENKSSFSARLMRLKMLILDEADHLLDLGFRKDMEKIVDCLPRQRQSLLFSATIPKEVRRISQLVLKRDHVYIDTIGLGCLETHAKVKQSYLVSPHELHFQIVHHLLKEHITQVPEYKVIVFCSTAMMTSLMFSLLRDMKMNVREIHSRKPQLYRTRVSDEFKEAKRLILITSDVSSRGMNYPDVSLVIQVGNPSDREQYIHRLGRTGREGKGGEGMLLLAPWEEYFLDEIKDLPIQKSSSPYLDPDMKLKIESSIAKIDTSVKEAAYHAWLGYYNSNRNIGRDKTTLVELAKGFCESIGLEKPPALFRKTAVKMGLKDIPGIRIRK